MQALDLGDIRAAVVAVINPGNNLYNLLSKDWLATSSEETLIVSLVDGDVNYLSPLKNGFSVFHK